MAIKQDSNMTGLRFAEEASLKTLPGSPIWYQLEPNSYQDFGGQIATVARNPINASRQRKKGATTDLDASGGFNQDLTMNNMTRILQGAFFAAVREKANTHPMNGTAVPCTGVTAADDKYAYGADPGAFVANQLVFASGFTNAGNNGLKVVVSSDADDITVGDGLVNETPASTAKVQVVGRQGASGDLTLSASGNLIVLGSTALDFTTLGLLEGEWIYVGGDNASTAFANGNQGFARIAVDGIAATSLTFDKVSWTPASLPDNGAGKTIRLFFGTVLRNEPASADITRRLIQLERTLGEDDNGEQSEYLLGAVANEVSFNFTQADKVTVDMSFVACDVEQRDGTTGVKSGSRPDNVVENAINTSSDIKRIMLSVVGDDATPEALFAFVTDVSVTINNNVTPNKAIGTLGAFDTTAGTFEVGGQLTAYFAEVAAVQAVRNNSDVTLDIIMARDNAGIIIDLPLVGLGDGRLNVEQDQPIQLPLENNAAQSAFGYTMLMMFFPYLPDAATA